MCFFIREAAAATCVECHSKTTPGIVTDWKLSKHGALGLDCATCHGKEHISSSDVAKAAIPKPETCAPCHAERVKQYKAGKHALAWAAMEAMPTIHWQPMVMTEGMKGCGGCHKIGVKTEADIQSIKKNSPGFGTASCDACHTRHTFSVEEARQPQACQTCHMGFDHAQWEMYSASKHGVRFLLKQNKVLPNTASAPTCQTCHMEFEGKFSHNMVRKVRWANYPSVPGIAENIKGDWSEKRLEAWVKTCTQCHSESLARSYLDLMDKGTLQGLAKFQEAHKVVEKLYADKLLPGQTTNRPAPPPPDKEGVAQFWQLFWTKGNQPSSIEFEAIEMGENDLAKLHVGMAHVNPGGWTYTEGFEPLNRAYSKIMSEDTKIREMAALKDRVAKLEVKRVSLLDPDNSSTRVSLGGLGGALLLAGGVALVGWRRREKSDR
jgi:hypothetical protein